MEAPPLTILLTDDDTDDCLFFKDALEELHLDATSSIVKNGVERMNFLTTRMGDLPNVLFLDLNMPRRSGFECLSEIINYKNRISII